MQAIDFNQTARKNFKVRFTSPSKQLAHLVRQPQKFSPPVATPGGPASMGLSEKTNVGRVDEKNESLAFPFYHVTAFLLPPLSRGRGIT